MRDVSVVEKLGQKISSLDILVNNAGVQIEKQTPECIEEDWENVMGTNAKGVFNVCRAFIPVMPTGGSIINIRSISGGVADRSMTLYNASKAFVHGLSRSIAVDHGPDLRCKVISPGWIETGMLEADFNLATEPARARQATIDRHATRRFGHPKILNQWRPFWCLRRPVSSTVKFSRCMAD